MSHSFLVLHRKVRNTHHDIKDSHIRFVLEIMKKSLNPKSCNDIQIQNSYLLIKDCAVFTRYLSFSFFFPFLFFYIYIFLTLRFSL